MSRIDRKTYMPFDELHHIIFKYNLFENVRNNGLLNFMQLIEKWKKLAGKRHKKGEKKKRKRGKH